MNYAILQNHQIDRGEKTLKTEVNLVREAALRPQLKGHILGKVVYI